MANSGIPIFSLLAANNHLLRYSPKRDRPRVWHCDYCGTDYDEKPEACRGCGSRSLRPLEDR